MAAGPDFARSLRPGEEAEVDALLRAAFPGPEEAALVRRLRAEGDIVLEMVLPWQDRIAAYAGVSRMIAPKNWFCLAPVAVWPDLQNAALALEEGQRHPYRFGSRLVSQIVAGFSGPDLHERLAKTGLLDGDEPVTLVVLGKPSFYARAGFSGERAVRMISPYPVAYTLILRSGDDLPAAKLVYPRAFAEVP